MSAPATDGWSCINLMRVMGVSAATKSAIHAKWESGLNPPQTSTTIDPAKVDGGTSYLVVNGFATFDSGTGIVTATRLDVDGRPYPMRRVPGDDFTLQYLPAGAMKQDGT